MIQYPRCEGNQDPSEPVVECAAALEEAYDLGKTIGRGEFAKVKVARCRLTKKLVPGQRLAFR